VAKKEGRDGEGPKKGCALAGLVLKLERYTLIGWILTPSFEGELGKEKTSPVVCKVKDQWNEKK